MESDQKFVPVEWRLDKARIGDWVLQLEILAWVERLQQELFLQEIDQLVYQDMKISFKQMHQ